MFINGDGIWVILLKDAVFLLYNNNIHTKRNITPFDASNNPEN